MSITLFCLLLNLLICSACSKHQQFRSSLYDEYKLVQLTYNVENVIYQRSDKINLFICDDGNEPKLKVVASLKKAAQEISKALFDKVLLQKIITSKKIEHGGERFSTQEITYSKKGRFNSIQTN